MLFAKPGKYEPCGLLTKGHLELLITTILGIIIALNKTKEADKESTKKIIRICTIILWVMEIIKIIFNLLIGNIDKPNTYIPLYYCSLILYAGIFSSIGKGVIKKIGDTFIMTGSLIGGICFLISPNTSLTTYPMWHYISIQSFIFHGIMVYLGILLNKVGYEEIKFKDIFYNGGLVTIASILAYIVNIKFDTNLMFVSKNFPNTPIDIIYKITGNFFTPIMIIVQATIPFILVYQIRNKIWTSKNAQDIKKLFTKVSEKEGLNEIKE